MESSIWASTGFFEARITPRGPAGTSAGGWAFVNDDNSSNNNSNSNTSVNGNNTNANANNNSATDPDEEETWTNPGQTLDEFIASPEFQKMLAAERTLQ